MKYLVDDYEAVLRKLLGSGVAHVAPIVAAAGVASTTTAFARRQEP